MEFILLSFLVFEIICAGVGGYIAGEKNRDIGSWAIICLFLGVFGIIAIVAVPALPFQREIRLSQKQAVGVVGCWIIFVGAFMPVISFPRIGVFNYFESAQWGGMLLLILSAVSFLLVLKNYLKWLWITGAASFALICFTFTSLQLARHSVSKQIFAELGVTKNTMEIHLEWGAVIILIGIGCVIACATMNIIEDKSEKS